jgi:hypothetical protein
MVAATAWDAAFGFAGTVRETCPLPVPEEGLALSPEALHEQVVLEAVTVTYALPPMAETCRVAGLMPKEQPEAANCVIVYTELFTVIMPVRWLPVRLG